MTALLFCLGNQACHELMPEQQPYMIPFILPRLQTDPPHARQQTQTHASIDLDYGNQDAHKGHEQLPLCRSL